MEKRKENKKIKITDTPKTTITNVWITKKQSDIL